MKNIFFISFIFSVLLFACNTSTEKDPIVSENSFSLNLKNKKNIPDTTTASIFNALYNSYDAANKYATVPHNMIPDSILNPLSLSKEDELKSTLEKIIPLENDYYFVYYKILPSIEYECRICAPILAGAYLKKEKNQWSIGQANIIDLAGIYGIAPDMDAIKISDKNYALVAGLADLHMGIIWSANNYYSLDNFKTLVLINTHLDNSGACDLEDEDSDLPKCYENETEIEIVKKEEGFYDIKAHTKGTNWDYEMDTLITLDESVTYIYQNGKYLKEE